MGVDVLELKVTNIQNYILMYKNGITPAVIDKDLFVNPIILCGEIDFGPLVLEISLAKGIRGWYGKYAQQEKKNLSPDEEWPYILRNGQFINEYKSIKGGVVYGDKKGVYLIGAGFLLSNEYCYIQR